MSKLALVTGASGGIGEAICHALAADKVRVIAAGSNSDEIEKWVAQKKEQGLDLLPAACDVSDAQSCAAMTEQIKKDYGDPDIIINNAGITRDAPFKRMSLEQWSEVINTNLNGLFYITSPFFNAMLEKGFGRIVNISSINGQKGQFGQANYAATKAGMHGFTMSLAQEGAAKGVTVNSVSPGYTATPMVTAIREDILEGIIKQIPAKRLAETAEVASIVAYLCRDEAAFINGANIPVNGAQFTSF